MATTRPYAFNSGSTINGTQQVGDIAIGTGTTLNYGASPGDVQWWMGPDEDLGCVIIVQEPSMTHPTPIGDIAGIHFKRSNGFTDTAILNTINALAVENGLSGFTNMTDAENWLILSGYPYTYNSLASKSAFIMDTFNFTTNQLLDKSGNNNHISLKDASARTGNGSNLDYTITGLLTSDTVSVTSGSDTPTIPSNGILRIGASQVVYGVTITRSSSTWAVIPFCEPYMNENLPTISYDVSGNGHHATCATLASGNITTQDNYFYLQQYGYSLRAADLLNWNTGSWTGNVSGYTAIFNGVSLTDTQTSSRYLEPTTDGLGCRYTHNGTGFGFAELSVLTVGKRYRNVMDFQVISGSTSYPGLQVGNLGFSMTNKKWFISSGRTTIDIDGVAAGTHYIANNSNATGTETVEFYNPKCYLMVIVPALMTGTTDAVGNTIEYVPDGSTWLNYACSLQLPSGLTATDQKGYWSDYMNQGYCINGKTYLIEATETNHFGSGKEIFDEFVSNGTEALNDNNVVRELILHGTQRGFFFDDDTTPHPRAFSEFKNIKTHFIYCDREKDEQYCFFVSSTPALYPLNFDDNATVEGWKGYRDTNQIANITILKSDTYLTDVEKISMNARFKRIEEPTFAMVSFVYDSWTNHPTTGYTADLAVFNNRNIRLTRAIYFSDNVTSGQTNAILSDFHEIIAHTPGYGATLSTYKGFHEDEENYTDSTLGAYYADVVAWIDSNGYYNGAKILPGGQNSVPIQNIGPNHFNMLFLATGSDRINRAPIVKYEHMGRAGAEFLDASEVTAVEGYVDTAIAVKGWMVIYSHEYSHNANTLTNQGITFDYIIDKAESGEMIRFCKIEDAYNIMKKIK